MNVLKNLNPTKQPVAYVFLAIVLYQLFVKGDPLPENWAQYAIEFVGAIIARQSVKPLAKIKEEGNDGRD